MAGAVAGAMAGAVVVEAALSAVFQGLSQALTSMIQKKLSNVWEGFDEEQLKKVARYIVGVQPLLDDAETRQFTDDAVRSWVRDLREVAYDLEDIVEEINTELLSLSNPEDSKVSQFVNVLRKCFSCDDLNKNIDAFLEKWEDIVKYGDNLRLRDGSIGGRALEVIGKRRETTSLVVESCARGRSAQKGKILSFLKSDATASFSVIGIVGMAGVGKTTLAKQVYKEAGEFDLSAWIHVSHEFDCAKVTRSIIESITGAPCELRPLDALQRTLQLFVANEKLLLVLDDAWTENHDDWETLTAPLRSAGKGTKIILTTRSEGVCKSAGVDEVHTLMLLSDEDCWVLFKTKLIACNYLAHEHPHVESFRVEVVRKCKGLPLTANLLGELLSTIEMSKWRRVLKSEIWDLPKTKADILPALMLSYLYFPSRIKHCFAYTAIFPKGHMFEKDDLVHLWMAEGFIEASKIDTLEDAGNEYFDYLVARHVLRKEASTYYVMHDLFHDLAEEILGSTFFRTGKEVDKNIPTKETRYIYLDHIVLDKTLLDKLSIAKSLRTLLKPENKINKEVLDDLINNFERLHVLSLSFSSIEELPESIWKLQYLRFLDLRYNSIERLPDSICELKELQVINLSGCEKFTALPMHIGRLINLHSLDLTGTNIQRLPDSICELINLHSLKLLCCKELLELPKEMINLINLRILEVDTVLLKNFLLPMIGRFPNLQRLKEYSVATESGIGALSDLANLRGVLSIMDLENVQSAEEARTAKLKDKYGIQNLGLHWSELDPLNLRDEELEVKVLEALEPPCPELRHLVIKNYGGFKFPSWMGDTSFSKLVDIKLIDCRKANRLPTLGELPSLENLVIEGMHELKNITDRGILGQGSFPSLKTLILNHLPNLEGVLEVHEGEFKHLFKLEVRNCSKITELPVGLLNFEDGILNSLTEILIVGCPKLVSLKYGLPSSLRKLEIDSCAELTSLPDKLPSSLIELEIRSCAELTSLPDEIPLSLERIVIFGCCKIISLSKGLHQLTFMDKIFIIQCPKIESFPEDRLPLHVDYLQIDSCPELTSLHNGLPSSLGVLEILACPGLTSLPDKLPSSLRVLNILACDELTSLPDELPSSLERIFIAECAKIKSLPKGLCRITSLQSLAIRRCPLIESFPEDGLPIHLNYLHIAGCPNLLQRCQLQGSREWKETKHVQRLYMTRSGFPASSGHAMSSIRSRFLSRSLEYVYFRCSLSLCTVGGMLSAGTTHLAITPLDVLKVNMQAKFSLM